LWLQASEGIDFADSQARAVVVVGIPFPNVKDTKVGARERGCQGFGQLVTYKYSARIGIMFFVEKVKCVICKSLLTSTCNISLRSIMYTTNTPVAHVTAFGKEEGE
jgi:hypothetical protein